MQGFASRVCHQSGLTIILCPCLLRSTLSDLWIDPLLTCCILTVAQRVKLSLSVVTILNLASDSETEEAGWHGQLSA